MKKFFTVLLWILLAVMGIMLIAVMGERNTLRHDLRKQQNKYEALQTLREQDKKQWESLNTALKADNTALLLEKKALTAALANAQEEQAVSDAERLEASGKLTEILAVLQPDTAQAQHSAAAEEAPLPLPARHGPQPVALTE